MARPVVSCVVPVFNGERYLGEALDSILAQTYRPLEVIVADDGSTDDTAGVMRRYGDRIRCVQQAHAGAPVARNLGLAAAVGDYIAFLDADDLWHPEKLSRQMTRFAARADLDVCVTHLQSFWIAALRQEAERFRNHPLAQPQPGYVTTTMLVTRSLFDRVGGFDTRRSVGDPMEWFVRAAESGARMELLPDVLVYRRMHERNLSWQSDGERRMTGAMQSAIVRVVKESLDRRRASSGAVRPYDFPDAVPPPVASTARTTGKSPK
jgi:glycosyltransferase involved in cell wall biosynthesis